jgi:hypothetical protein
MRVWEWVLFGPIILFADNRRGQRYLWFEPVEMPRLCGMKMRAARAEASAAVQADWLWRCCTKLRSTSDTGIDPRTRSRETVFARFAFGRQVLEFGVSGGREPCLIELRLLASF